MPKDVVCSNCGSEFTVTPSRYKRNTSGNFYCSNKCQSNGMVRDEHPRWNDSLKFSCKYCGKEFRGKKGNPNTYCSQTCAGKDKPLKDRVDDEVWERIKEEQSERFSGENNPMKNEETKGEVIKKMTQTRKEQGSPWNKGENNGMYGKTGRDNPAWRGGGEDYYGESWVELRRNARKRDNYECQNCGKREESIDRELDVHHIKPRRKFDNVENANYMENVITLCMSCHRMAEFGDLEVEN